MVSGDTATDPDSAPPVEKLVPVQVVALPDHHDNAASPPRTTVLGFRSRPAVTTGVCLTIPAAYHSVYRVVPVGARY